MSSPFDDDLLRKAAARRTLLSLLDPSLSALPKTNSPFADALAALNPPPKPALPTTRLGSIGSLLGSPYLPPANTNPFAGLFEPSPPQAALSGLFGSIGSTPPALPIPVNQEPVKRKAFFSFHYADVMRVNNVRQEGKINKRATERNFYDASLWESKKLEGPDALKKLIREGMEGASAVCVLVGSETWSRRWVKYEIARAVIEQKGLFGIHINGLKHHQRRQADPHGFNPFHHMGVYKDANGKFYLWEMKYVLIKCLHRSEGMAVATVRGLRERRSIAALSPRAASGLDHAAVAGRRSVRLLPSSKGFGRVD